MTTDYIFITEWLKLSGEKGNMDSTKLNDLMSWSETLPE